MRRFQHGTSGVGDDDNVDAVDIDRVLGFPPVETVDDAWCGRIRQGGRIVDDDDDNVDAVDIELGLSLVEMVGDAWCGGRRIGRIRRSGR